MAFFTTRTQILSYACSMPFSCDFHAKVRMLRVSLDAENAMRSDKFRNVTGAHAPDRTIKL